MNEDMPWANLTQEEIEELRKQKYELAEYAKEKLRKLIYEQDVKKMNDAAKNLVLENLTHEEMLEEAERREKSNRVLERYNDFYNMECASLPHGTPITPEHQQMITLQCMIDALRCENLNREYNEITISDIEDLIKRLDEQATAFLKKVEEFKDSANGVA
jgi:tRNA threonylcarbamoyladenosine modification (KEOPS) complex Cgi121 subunit